MVFVHGFEWHLFDGPIKFTSLALSSHQSITRVFNVRIFFKLEAVLRATFSLQFGSEQKTIT